MRIPKPAALFAAVLLLFSVLSQSFVSAMEPAQASTLLITEVQTGGTDNASLELVELYNSGNSEVDLREWQLQYLAATGTGWIVKSNLTGVIAAGGYYLIATTDYTGARQATMSSGLSANGGHVRVVAPGIGTTDLTSWGSALQPDGTVAAAPAAGMSIQRCTTDGATYIDTNINGDDFAEYPPSPGVGVVCISPEPEVPEAPETHPQCQSMIFSEVLPNPAGSDTGAEFIELFNPTGTTINLAGCTLQINDKHYTFGDTPITARGYLVISDVQTGLSLPNTPGGTIYLLAGDIEVATVIYPASMPDGAVWAWSGNQWQASYEATPGQSNVLLTAKPCPAGQTRSTETGRCRSLANPANNELTPCKTGQERNPETNRCRAVAGASTGLTPCKPGRIRNPNTNRCRAADSTASTLVPCKSGQERNPATNRCRSIGTTSTSLKPCTDGQERNPETNRCRKIATVAATHPVEVKDVASTSKAPVAWWLLGMIGIGAASYAIYEWRHEIMKKIAAYRTQRRA